MFGNDCLDYKYIYICLKRKCCRQDKRFHFQEHHTIKTTQVKQLNKKHADQDVTNTELGLLSICLNYHHYLMQTTDNYLLFRQRVVSSIHAHLNIHYKWKRCSYKTLLFLCATPRTLHAKQQCLTDTQNKLLLFLVSHFYLYFICINTILSFQVWDIWTSAHRVFQLAVRV